MNGNTCKPEVAYDDLVYEFTAKREYIRQYAALVIEFYKKELNLDLTSHNMADDLCRLAAYESVFIVRDGEKVVAGAKLSFSSINAAAWLPMESAVFRVKSILPEHFGNTPYAEIGRLVVNPDYRGKEVLARIIESLSSHTHQRGGRYLFVLAPPMNAVLYRRVCRSLSMDVALHKDVDWGDKAAYTHLRLQLISCDIRYLYAHNPVSEGEIVIAV